MKKVRAAVVGLGHRGYGLLTDLILKMDNVEVVAVCDLYDDRTEEGVKAVEEAYGRTPFASTDYREVLDRDGIEAVFVLSAWESHFPVAIYAMERGIAVGMEVGGAYSVDDCWELVRTYERTKTPFMFLENCCYGEIEMLVLNMVEQGILGEIVHCSGGYHHDLRDEVALGEEKRHYRLRNYLSRNCENYPTHELGPIAKVLDINKGNRFVSLVSMSSKAAGVNEYARNHSEVPEYLRDAKFAQGDVVTTIIKCARGETVTLTLDTTLPRPYSRGFTVRGTKGMFQEDTDSFYIDGETTGHAIPHGNRKEYLERYSHPTWVEYHKSGIRGGHGGMDGLVYDAFIEAVRLGKPCPIDVYDAVAWMVVTPLSEQSIAMGGAPVTFPDFTSGRWYKHDK